jgi:hypothetical protein
VRSPRLASPSSDRKSLSNCFAKEIIGGPRLPFATLTTSRSAPNVYASIFISTYQILLHPDCSCCRDKVNRVASRRASCHGFCMPPRQFYRDMTNPAHLSGPGHLDSFIVTPNARPSIGTLQKHMPTLTLRCAQGRLRRHLLKPPGRWW